MTHLHFGGWGEPRAIIRSGRPASECGRRSWAWCRQTSARPAILLVARCSRQRLARPIMAGLDHLAHRGMASLWGADDNKPRQGGLSGLAWLIAREGSATTFRRFN